MIISLVDNQDEADDWRGSAAAPVQQRGVGGDVGGRGGRLHSHLLSQENR